MKNRHYDNYDYEEAYKKQCENLEEWEIERLIQSGKIDCLYRTTTYKSVNIKSATVFLESMVYPSFNNKADMPKTAKKRETSPSHLVGMTGYCRNAMRKQKKMWLISYAG